MVEKEFKDSDGDTIGDFAGVKSEMDYFVKTVVGTEYLEISKAVNQDEKVRKLEEANQSLHSSFEEAVNECEEKAKATYNLEETVKNLLEKLENTEKKNLRAAELSALKDDEIDSLKIRNEKLVSGNKALRNESKELVKEFDLFKRGSMQSKKKLESSIELLESLEKGLVYQRSEAKVDLMKVENERAELKRLGEKSLIEKNEVQVKPILIQKYLIVSQILSPQFSALNFVTNHDQSIFSQDPFPT